MWNPISFIANYLLPQLPQPSGHESVSEGCLRRMRGVNRESMYGEYNSGQENLKPAPVVQILRWQGDRKEWVVIDLVPETSQPHQSDKKTQEKTAVKDICQKSKGITSEPCQPDKMSSPKKTQEKTMVNNSCKKSEGMTSESHQSENISISKKTQPKEGVKNNSKKTDTIKTCFCFDWKEKAFNIPKCMKKVNNDENPISNERITTVETKNNKISSGDQSSKHKAKDVSEDQRNNANLQEEPTKAFESSPILPPKKGLNQTFRKANNKSSNISFNPDRRDECGMTMRNSKVKGNHNNDTTSLERYSDSAKYMTHTFCKVPTKDVEDDKVLKAAILVTEATIKTVDEMKVAKKCDIVVKNMGYKADIANEHRPIWNTVAPNTKFNLSKQADNNKSARVTPEHLTNSSAKAGNIETRKHLQKCPRLCETEKTLKKTEAEKDFILGLLNTLIYEVAKKKATEGEAALHDQSLKEAMGNSKILFADEDNQSEQADKLDFNEEKSAVDCAMRTLEEVNGFETSRSWY